MRGRLFFYLMFLGCQSLVTDEVKDFIPGTYTRFARHEFGTEYDTLVISVQNLSANQYFIQRNWKYERILDGIALEPEYKQTKTSGIYKHKILQQTETGNMFSFDINEGWLFN